MKNKLVKKMLCLSVSVMLAAAVPVVSVAAEAENVQTQENTQTAENTENAQIPEMQETETPEETIPEEFTFSLKTGDIVIKNEAKIIPKTAEYVKTESTPEDAAVQADAVEDILEQKWTLQITEEKEKVPETPENPEEGLAETTEEVVHKFDAVRADKWTAPVLKERFGFLYIEYTDENLEVQEAWETGEEKELEQPITVYATTEVNIRETADTQAQSLAVTTPGAEWKAVAALPGWVKVEANGVTGYVYQKYVTEDPIQAAPTAVPEPTKAPSSSNNNTQNSSGNSTPSGNPGNGGGNTTTAPDPVTPPSGPSNPVEPETPDPSVPEEPVEIPSEEPSVPEIPDAPAEPEIPDIPDLENLDGE